MFGSLAALPLAPNTAVAWPRVQRGVFVRFQNMDMKYDLCMCPLNYFILCSVYHLSHSIIILSCLYVLSDVTIHPHAGYSDWISGLIRNHSITSTLCNVLWLFCLSTLPSPLKPIPLSPIWYDLQEPAVDIVHVALCLAMLLMVLWTRQVYCGHYSCLRSQTKCPACSMIVVLLYLPACSLCSDKTSWVYSNDGCNSGTTLILQQ